jgi:branched-chain amino acid transport system ATP-binding protein
LDGEQPVLVVDGVHAGYRDVSILRGVDLALAPGTMTAVIGANGAGKSTLLNTIFGIVRPSAGRILFNGMDVTRLSTVARLRSGLVIIPQGRSNFAEMTVQENLEMGAFIRHDKNVARDIRAAYERFPILGSRRAAMAGNLSGGEQQILELAMALMLDPKVALVDEPSLGLDPGMQQTVFGAIGQLRDAGTTLLMVEQNAVQALRIADRAIVLELGRVSAAGSGPQMLDDPEVRRAYLGLAS